MSPRRRSRLTSSSVTDPTAALQDEIAAKLRAYDRASDADKTELLREAADLIVQLRSHFTHDGGPDWRGRSGAYRAAMAEVFGLAAVPVSDRQRLSATLRYHISIALHERLDEATIVNLDMRPISSRQRLQERHRKQAALLAAAKSAAGQYPAVRALESALALLTGASGLDDLPAEDRAKVRELARAVGTEADRIARAAGARRRG